MSSIMLSQGMDKRDVELENKGIVFKARWFVYSLI